MVNRNGLKYTLPCIESLGKQDVPFDFTLIDNGSDELYTQPKLSEAIYNLPTASESAIRCLKFNGVNQPLNHIWNWFASTSDNPYLCFLNNDIILPRNFVSDSEAVFSTDCRIGITCHLTNTQIEDEVKAIGKCDLDYITFANMAQGWDFTLKRELYVPVPEELLWLCGDDFIWYHIFKQSHCAALLYSSPIAHFQGKTPRPKPLVTFGDIQRLQDMGVPQVVKTVKKGHGLEKYSQLLRQRGLPIE